MMEIVKISCIPKITTTTTTTIIIIIIYQPVLLTIIIIIIIIIRNLDPQELQANCMSANNFQDPNISNYRQIV